MVGSALVGDDRASNASSDNELDETMEDVDAIEVDVDVEADAEDDEDEEIGDYDDGEDEDETTDQPLSQALVQSEGGTNTIPSTHGVSDAGSISVPQVTSAQTSPLLPKISVPPKSQGDRYQARPEALSAPLYDIVPTIAAPQSTSINAITATPDMRYWFSGGSDCYIRRYDGVATINGKTLLTVAQRHPFVESVIKAGVLMSYWDNEEPVSKIIGEEPPLSPVYSLAVQSEALWILSGLDSGSINLYSVRHDEGKRIAYLNQHKSAVSVLRLAQDEKSVLSGSWDKNIFDWDLNTGQIKRSFQGSGGQISAIEIRPVSNLAVPEDSDKSIQTSDTFSSNNDQKPLSIGLPHSTNATGDGEGNEDMPGSQTDSLFGGSDTNSLFGETAGESAPPEDIFRKDPDLSMNIDSELNTGKHPDSHEDPSVEEKVLQSDVAASAPEIEIQMKQPSKNISHGAPESNQLPGPELSDTQSSEDMAERTFLTASMDGVLRIWDKRQQAPVATIPPRTGVPPWCMTVCWSPDGNFIYAGRRNGTVEEFSLHKGLKSVERTLKFPQGSGPVTAMRAMPNSRHLIW